MSSPFDVLSELTPEVRTLLHDKVFAPDEFLGSISTPTSSAQTTGSLHVPARDILVIQARVISYAQAGIVGFQFNGDTGNNYYTRYVTVAPGGTTMTNNEELSTS